VIAAAYFSSGVPVTYEDIRLPVAQESNNSHRESLNHVPQADLNEAARAADATREANVAVYGERLKYVVGS
jgi:hypothetical protein